MNQNNYSAIFNDEYYETVLSETSKKKAIDYLLKESLRIHRQIITNKLIEKYTLDDNQMEWNYEYEYKYLEDLKNALNSAMTSSPSLRGSAVLYESGEDNSLGKTERLTKKEMFRHVLHGSSEYDEPEPETEDDETEDDETEDDETEDDEPVIEDETEKLKYYQYQFPQIFDWICSFFIKQ